MVHSGCAKHSDVFRHEKRKAGLSHTKRLGFREQEPLRGFERVKQDTQMHNLGNRS